MKTTRFASTCTVVADDGTVVAVPIEVDGAVDVGGTADVDDAVDVGVGPVAAGSGLDDVVPSDTVVTSVASDVLDPHPATINTSTTAAILRIP